MTNRIMTPKGWRYLDEDLSEEILDINELLEGLAEAKVTHYNYPFSAKGEQRHSALMKHAASKGYKVNHSDNRDNNHGSSGTGNTPGSKPHKNPDITVHYDQGDKAHSDGANGIAIHHGGAAHKDAEMKKPVSRYSVGKQDQSHRGVHD